MNKNDDSLERLDDSAKQELCSTMSAFSIPTVKVVSNDAGFDPLNTVPSHPLLFQHMAELVPFDQSWNSTNDTTVE